jgi:hypothetical protein
MLAVPAAIASLGRSILRWRALSMYQEFAASGNQLAADHIERVLQPRAAVRDLASLPRGTTAIETVE